MAKQTARGGRRTPSVRLDAEETRLARLAAAAMQKERAGGSLTRQEASAIRAWHELQRTKYGEQYLAAIPKKDISRFTGRQPRTLIDWAQRYGIPYDRHSREIDGRKWFAFLADLLAEKGRILFTERSAEDDLLHLATGPLKDELVRRLIEKNEIANESARIDLERKRGTLVPVGPLADFHAQAAGMIARLSEVCGRRDMIPGYEVQQMVADLADDIGELAKSMFGEGAGEAAPDNHV